MPKPLETTVTVDGVAFTVRYDSDEDAIPTHYATELQWRDGWVDPRDILRPALCDCIDWAVTRQSEAQYADDVADAAIERADFLAAAQVERYQSEVA